ncbi:MAG: OmpA family protein [Cetobacterium sp.]|uniref:Chemotaxis protein MotB n=1 Tax=Cetobacterium ceti TaxID=180163 RepID=A0A1T4LEZ5_9FUSO|nr:OmpA family protein [Cetobacterium ceti]MCJ8343823.1 OmpA family protein [Cetobacterium sp.]SJZ53191.1 chemotaxis protein MotB [Cetobacterium ceti]
MNNKKKILGVLLGLQLFGACASLPQSPYGNTATGTAGGAAVGALLGQVIGQDTKGTLIGAGIGALAGLGWGAYKDRQEAEFRQRLQNTQIKIQDQGNYINLTLPSGVTFATNKYAINPGFYNPLNSIAYVLNQYPETRILIAGFTDNTGPLSYNQTLSQQRAQSVASYLISRGVNPVRISAQGYGPSDPVASNNTAAGRAENRRVEIQIYPAQ